MDIEEQSADEAIEYEEFLAGRYRRDRSVTKERNTPTIDSFLGAEARDTISASVPPYYTGVLVWALKRIVESEGWTVQHKLGYREPRPFFMPVEIALGKSEDCIASGQLLLEKGGVRICVTINGCSMQAESSAINKSAIERFVGMVKETVVNDNFYRGAKLAFIGQPKFLDVGSRTWEQVVLNPDVKIDIKSNTIDFLRQAKRLKTMGVPTKRGVLLSGSPGTGKTIICKALMGAAKGITCLNANAYLLDRGGYITDMYAMANDLKPSIVFIEDIDLIGQRRSEYGWGQASSLNSLLEELDGLEEQNGIVTVATTNSLETLDEALSKRPSRFDRVIKLPCPDFGQRQELVGLLCRKTRLESRIQEYISKRTQNFTPAQLQEVVYSLAIECGTRFHSRRTGYLPVTEADVEKALARIGGGRAPRIGFGLKNEDWR